MPVSFVNYDEDDDGGEEWEQDELFPGNLSKEVLGLLDTVWFKGVVIHDEQEEVGIVGLADIVIQVRSAYLSAVLFASLPRSTMRNEDPRGDSRSSDVRARPRARPRAQPRPELHHDSRRGLLRVVQRVVVAEVLGLRMLIFGFVSVTRLAMFVDFLAAFDPAGAGASFRDFRGSCASSFPLAGLRCLRVHLHPF